jgi:CRISPR/Cas system-associated protein Cas10 (large subunit of type III CRISPR-Cas system)
LEKHWGFKPDNFKMPNTRGLAAHDPEAKDPRSDCDEKDVEDIPPEHKYFAVLALDGDEIGKWVSGEKMPTFASQLADYTDAGGQVRHGAKVYFERNGMGGFLDAQRPLSPAYHLQFSEALSNFALRCVRPIVEAFDGRLIYAGGDDVLALLPADTALACASALRQAFRGETVTNPKKLGSVLFQSHAPGFLSQSGGAPDGQNQPIPFIVPGPAAEVSVGVAMAHFKAPLQDVVRAAQAAEKRAKNGLGRAAVAVTLMKRSGEIIEWGCRWDFGGLEAYESLLLAMKNESVSGKFPHRLAQLLSVYQGQSDDAEFSLQVDQIMEKEIAHVISRQGVRNEEGDRLHRHLLLYRDGMGSSETSAQAKLTGLTGLCATAAFAHRIQGEEA